MNVKTGVLGVSGYTGQELINYLLKHPLFKIDALFSTSLNGPYSTFFPEYSFYDLPDVKLYDIDLCSDLDLLFLAVPHTKSMNIVKSLVNKYPSLKIVDLSADFRLKNVDQFNAFYSTKHDAVELIDSAVYGLPEVYKEQLAKATLCANPGCYATSIILGTLPVKGFLDQNAPIVIDAKSGVSGAGKSLKESSLFCEVDGQLSAYSTGKHRHLAEFYQEVGFENVMFSPHLVPMDRGIESAIYISNNLLSENELFSIYDSYYENHPFVTILPSKTTPATGLVRHSNHCMIIPKKIGDWIVVFSLLDNLGKGASGQAIQNANIMFGLDERTGLI